jgi:hypothetical protein
MADNRSLVQPCAARRVCKGSTSGGVMASGSAHYREQEAAATTNGQVFENLLTERSVPTAYTKDASGPLVPGSGPGRRLQQRAAQCVS